MQLLILDSTYRQWLNSRAALSFDQDLNEKFLGLTHSESIFFAKISKIAPIPLESLTVDELEHFINLYERHERMLTFSRESDGFKAQ